MPHIHELYDFIVGVFIVYDNKVLMVNHPRYGLWAPPGGHIELDENPEEALFREIAEETGLEVEILSTNPNITSPEGHTLYTPNYVDVHDANAPHRHVGLNYFARATHNKHVKSSEHTDMRWLSLADLEKSEYSLSPRLKFYCQEAIKTARHT